MIYANPRSALKPKLNISMASSTKHQYNHGDLFRSKQSPLALQMSVNCDDKIELQRPKSSQSCSKKPRKVRVLKNKTACRGSNPIKHSPERIMNVSANNDGNDSLELHQSGHIGTTNVLQSLNRFHSNGKPREKRQTLIRHLKAILPPSQPFPKDLEHLHRYITHTTKDEKHLAEEGKV